MQLVETTNEGLKRGYEVTITAADLDAKVVEKLQVSRADMQIKGFRKGHAPIALIKKMYGKSIIGEAMQESIDAIMKNHFSTSGDKPAMQPDVQMVNQDWKEGEDINVSLKYEKLPEIPETDFSKIKLKKLVVEIDDNALKDGLKGLAGSAQNFEKRKKTNKSKSGDQVIIDFLGKVDEEPFEGGAAKDYPLVLGSNSFIPGFEDQLIGVKDQQELKVKVTFPKDYGSEKLAGKDAIFTVTVKSINEPKPAKIDDDLAKKFGASSLKELEGQVKERLKSEFSVASRAILKKELMDKLDKIVKFDLPPTLIENESSQIAHQLWHEENPDVKDHNHDTITPTKNHTEIATRRVKLGLLVAELGTNNNITVSEQELQNSLMQKAQEYPGQEKAFFEFMQKNPQAQEQLRAPLFEDKVIDFILELASVSEKVVSKDELKKAVEKLETA